MDYDPPTGRGPGSWSPITRSLTRTASGWSSASPTCRSCLTSTSSASPTWSARSRRSAPGSTGSPAAALLQAFDLPFADTSLGDVLNLKDVITDAGCWITTTRTKRHQKSRARTTRRSCWTWLKRRQHWVRRVRHRAAARQKKLDDLLEPGIHRALLSAACTKCRTARSCPTTSQARRVSSIDVDPQAVGDQPLIVPLDFQLDLGPLASVETDGKLQITASGDGRVRCSACGSATRWRCSTQRPRRTSRASTATPACGLNTNLALTSLGEDRAARRTHQRQRRASPSRPGRAARPPTTS